ncbi:uncharacterized protein [Haliotis asinina]|uniref:uncharacterized protein n=1 Tax=Haliotis asinina TaxID=109174 RepID=UPI00353277C8
MPALLGTSMCLVFFMTFPDRIPGENVRQTVFRKDTKFDDITVAENAVFGESDIETVSSCAILCIDHSGCESFFYNKYLQACSGQPSSLDTTTTGFNEPGSTYFKPVAPERVAGSCFDNVTATAISSAAEAVCGSGKNIQLASPGPHAQPLVTREMIIDGHCMEDKWNGNSGSKVSYFCIRNCLLGSTKECTSAVIRSDYLCQ